MFPFLKTLNSIIKAKLWGLMLASAGLAVVIIIVAVGGVNWLAFYLANFETGWINTLIGLISGGIAGVAGWFMLPVITLFVAGLFQDITINRVERVFYPDEAHTETPGFLPDIVHVIKFTLLALFLNLLVLPLYLIGIGFIISVVLNSYLTGREFFETAAGYHLGKPKAKKLYQKNRAVVYGGGLIIVLTTLVPLLNLFVPILGVSWMVHVYHRVRNQAKWC